jgi:hypothetical protein
MVGLGDLPGGSEGSQAFDVSADGTVVVGSGDWSTGGGWKAFIWDADNGMRNLQDVLIAQGADLTGWELEIASGVSADGKTIVGDGSSRGAYLATLDTSPIPPAPVDLSGTIKTPDGTDICAMVLASGQYMFSCNPIGMFSLADLPREGNGTVKRQIYADGFFPKIDILTGSTTDALVMTRSGACPSYNTLYDPAFVPDSAGKRINIVGKVLVQDTQTPICAMVLANGQYTFSCDGSGNYALNIPLNSNGQFKLQVYADGFAPTIQTFDELKATNDVRMARAAECQ